MTKRTSRQPPGQVEDIGHLDETLTEITSTTAATLKKYRYPILGAIGVVSLIAVGIAVGVGIHERGLTSENEALWSLLQSPAAESAGPSLGAIDGLLEDARGTLAERYIVKSVGEYLGRKKGWEWNQPSRSASGWSARSAASSPRSSSRLVSTVTGPQRADSAKMASVTTAYGPLASRKGRPTR